MKAMRLFLFSLALSAAAAAVPPPSPELLSSSVASLLPYARDWAIHAEAEGLAHGSRLTDQDMADARRFGVQHPENIRLMIVDKIPAPTGNGLDPAATRAGLISPENAGLTVGYAIYLRSDCLTNRALLIHEFTHVAQVERLGGLDAFVTEYFNELALHGYDGAALEQEALLAERSFNRLNEPQHAER